MNRLACLGEEHRERICSQRWNPEELPTFKGQKEE